MINIKLPSLVTLNLVQLLCDRVSISECVIPHVAPNTWRQTLNPELSYSLGTFNLVPIWKDFLFPHAYHLLLMLFLSFLLNAFLVHQLLPVTDLNNILLSIFLYELLMLLLFNLCLWWQILRPKCHWLDPIRHLSVTSSHSYILQKVFKFFCERYPRQTTSTDSITDVTIRLLLQVAVLFACAVRLWNNEG